MQLGVKAGCHKFKPRQVGPYRIVKQISPNTYQLTPLNPTKRSRDFFAHVQRIEKYVDREKALADLLNYENSKAIDEVIAVESSNSDTIIYEQPDVSSNQNSEFSDSSSNQFIGSYLRNCARHSEFGRIQRGRPSHINSHNATTNSYPNI